MKLLINSPIPGDEISLVISDNKMEYHFEFDVYEGDLMSCTLTDRNTNDTSVDVETKWTPTNIDEWTPFTNAMIYPPAIFQYLVGVQFVHYYHGDIDVAILQDRIQKMFDWTGKITEFAPDTTGW